MFVLLVDGMVFLGLKTTVVGLVRLELSIINIMTNFIALTVDVTKC